MLLIVQRFSIFGQMWLIREITCLIFGFGGIFMLNNVFVIVAFEDILIIILTLLLLEWINRFQMVVCWLLINYFFCCFCQIWVVYFIKLWHTCIYPILFCSPQAFIIIPFIRVMLTYASIAIRSLLAFFRLFIVGIHIIVFTRIIL